MVSNRTELFKKPELEPEPFKKPELEPKPKPELNQIVADRRLLDGLTKTGANHRTMVCIFVRPSVNPDKNGGFVRPSVNTTAWFSLHLG